MQYIYGTTDISQKKNSIVVLGNFDGVHIGHQKLFEVAAQKAEEERLQIVVFSFYPHPSWVIGNTPKPLLMSRRDKEETIKKFQVDVLIEYPFTTEFASISAEKFFIEILMTQLRAKVIIIGSNYFFGRKKEGNQYYLRELGQKYNCKVCIVDTVKIEGKTISSSTIRDLIVKGDIETANKLLGHPYSVVGNVIQGKQLGRTIGFPTINIMAEPDRIYPPKGVYATKIHVYNRTYWGMTNIGYNPTVSGTDKMIETHIFDFDEQLYDQEVTIYFYRTIRPEQKFESLTLLADQIKQDKEQVQTFFRSFEKSLDK
ncbi:bifunctional riboflavin kinase/FAD synthetase [Cellulosilyticum sp. I15G10I2]|uniref:bifunctional riboflavin kinase/FAD synthetase n=1 Tax=Cellulosilyticum sp. I15G10I2 TaxID=1892843 RepID=UPI00085CDCF1|nr:bifunctional riboflavin kinase/FAD synthetase [Cellulosilyticum sp. I15G10I2]